MSTELIWQTMAKTTIKASPPSQCEQIINLENRYAAKGLESLPVVITRGKGAKVWDTNGKEYIDFLSSFSVVNQGHSHPRIVKRMIEQCQQISLVSRAYHNEHYGPLCEKLCKLLDFDLAFPMNSGSEAVDLAIKISRKWAYEVKGIEDEKALVVTIAGNYHGKSLGPLSASSNEYIRNGFGPYIPGVGPVVDGRTMRFSNIEDLRYAFERQGERIAAVILECVQGYAGCLPAENSYLKEAYALCKENNALFIADEIQTGFGRTGYLMAYQAAGIKPDMITLGKALTGGAYSMSMVLGRKEAMSLLRYGQHSSTFSGNPLACAIASEAIDVVQDEKLSDRSMRLGAELKKRLESIQTPYTTLSVTGRGLFLSLYLDESHPSGRVTAHRLCTLMRQRGVLAFSYPSRIRLAPPLVINETDLWRGVEVIEKSLNDLVSLDGAID